MNKSIYFLIPAIVIVLGLIGYSTMNRSDEGAHNDAHTSAEHAAMMPATTDHSDSGEAAHAHE
jgi:hypothetical protein